MNPNLLKESHLLFTYLDIIKYKYLVQLLLLLLK